MFTIKDRPTDRLRYTALLLADLGGIKLKHIGTSAKDQLYLSADNERVRLRTTDVRCLTGEASSEIPEEATLKFEDCDQLLICMPAVKRTIGQFEAYYVPTKEVADTMRANQRKWLDSDDTQTAGRNRTPALWFDERENDKSFGFATKWAKFRIPFTVSVNTISEI